MSAPHRPSRLIRLTERHPMGELLTTDQLTDKFGLDDTAVIGNGVNPGLERLSVNEVQGSVYEPEVLWCRKVVDAGKNHHFCIR